MSYTVRKSSLNVALNKDYSEASIKGENNIKDPDEFELQIQYDRILLLLDTLIDKIKVAVCLPIFLSKNSSFMYQFLSPEDVNYINHRCLRYVLPMSSKTKYMDTSSYSTLIHDIALLRTAKPTSISQYGSTGSKPIDLHMKQVIQILCTNYKLKLAVQEQYKFLVDSGCINFIEILHQLRSIAADKLKVSAAALIEKNKALTKACRENKDIGGRITALSNEINIQRETFAKKSRFLNDTTQELEEKLCSYMVKYRTEVRSVLTPNGIIMGEKCESSKRKQADLLVQVKALQHQYESLQHQNMEREKKMRSKRSKVEQQLVSWLAKYDSDMTDRQTESDEITEGFNEEHEELLILQDKYQEQLELYELIIAEKEELEYVEWFEVLTKFIRNRAAKVIQRWIRRIFDANKKKDKKKKKKGKSKKGKKK